MLKRNNLIAYAMDFASYLISKVENINRIILHGSIAKADFDENSDVDLFIDADPKIEKKIKEVLEGYFKTTKYRDWNLKGIDHPLSVIVGKLESDEWKDLKRAIMNTGVILYGKYKANAEKVHQYTLFSFENIKPEKKRVALFRKIFGFSRSGKKYPGLAEKMNAVRVGKGSLLIPIEHVQEFKQIFQKERIAARLYDLWSDQKF